MFLDEILALCDAYNLQTREFYFDRSPKIFENILGLYRKGINFKINIECDFSFSCLHFGMIDFF